MFRESLLKDTFEQDQLDRLFLFQIKPQIMRLINVKDISDAINALNKLKGEKKTMAFLVTILK